MKRRGERKREKETENMIVIPKSVLLLTRFWPLLLLRNILLKHAKIIQYSLIALILCP